MESFTVLRQAVDRVGAKSVASNLGVSHSLVYKWCQPKGASEAGGVHNPLDRVSQVFACETTAPKRNGRSARVPGNSFSRCRRAAIL